MTIHSSVLTTTDINGGSIDGVNIATSDITVGSEKTLDLRGGILELDDNQISGNKVEGGVINATTINTLTSTNLELTNIKANDGAPSATIADSTGVMTIHSSVLTTTDINSGSIDGTTIGANDQSSIRGTTITADQGISTKNGNTTSGFIDFYESNNGTNKIKLKGQDTLASDVTLTLPSHSGTLVSTGATAQITPDMLHNTINEQILYLGSATQVPRIKFDAAGCITAVDIANISTTMSISAGTEDFGSIQIGTNTLNFDEGTGVSTSITGNSVTFAIGQDVSTTSSVTFDDITSTGGEISFWGYQKVANSENGNVWTISSPDSGESNIDNNLLIGTNLSTITTTDTDNYKNVTVIGHGAKARGDYVTAVGSFAGNALESETDGLTAYGYKAGRIFKGSWNTTVGYQSMGGTFTNDSSATNSGHQNVYFGHRAGGFSNGGGLNCGIGAYSLYRVTNTDYNTGGNVGIGYYTGHSITTGEGNLCCGFYAGNYLTSGNKNICIGYESGPADASGRIYDDKQLYIDTLGGYKEEDSLIYGDQSGTGSNLLYFNGIVGIHDTASNGTGEIRLYDGDDISGGDYVAIKAHPSIGAPYTLTLPSATGATNQLLKTDGSGNLSWTTTVYNTEYVNITNAGQATETYDVTFVGMSTHAGPHPLILRAVNEDAVNKRLTYNPSTGTLFSTVINCNTLNATDLYSNGNLTVDGDITLHDGGSLKEAGGLAALTFDPYGHITKIGQSDPIDGKYLKWDGSKAVWDTVSGSSGSFSSDVTINDADLKLSTTGTSTYDWILATREGHGGNSSAPALYSNIQLTTGDYGFIDGGLSSLGDDNNHQTRWNIGIGNEIGNSNSKTTGRFNTFVGNQIAKDTGTSLHHVGQFNVVMGNLSFFRGKGSNTTSVNACYNTILGTNAAYGVSGSTTSGSSNTIVGYKACYTLTSGANNICLGANAGHHNTTGNNNIFIGSYTGLNNSNDNYKLYIDNSVLSTGYVGTGSLIYGDQATDITYDTLKLNANVTISDDNPRSQGNLVVDGEVTTGAHYNNYGYNNTSATLSNVTLAVIGASPTEAGKIKSWGWNSSTLGSTVVTFNSNSTGMKALSFSQVCFLPGTKITLSDKIKINIENLRKGDTLLSYKLDDMPPYNKSVDVLSWFSEEDKGEFTESKVTNIWSDISPGYIILNDNLHVTHEHLIFTKMDDEFTWLSAKEIRKGDIVFTDKGEYEEITKIERVKEEVTVYNLRVTSSAMNYFADSYLVHNASLCDECASKNNKL